MVCKGLKWCDEAELSKLGQNLKSKNTKVMVTIRDKRKPKEENKLAMKRGKLEERKRGKGNRR